MTIQNKEKPFADVNFVIEQDLHPQVKKIKGSSFDIDCPFCNRKMKLHVQPPVWRCAACGESGNGLVLHSKLMHINTKEAYKDLEKIYSNLNDNQKNRIVTQIQTAKSINENISHPTSLDNRNVFNNLFLDNLILEDKHKNDLLRRGLSLKQIEQNGYKSFPMYNTPCENAWKKANLHLEKNEGIPGLFILRSSVFSKNMFNGKYGCYLIPCRTIENKISAFQLRYDSLDEHATEKEREHFHRYAWFSSNENHGCSFTGCENIHFAGDWSAIPKTVNLTEGILKADIASALSGSCFMGIAGVNNVSQLSDRLKYLKNHGTERINICLDMDYREKKEVKKALDNIINIISNSHLKPVLIKWDSKYKGIDDYLLSLKNK